MTDRQQALKALAKAVAAKGIAPFLVASNIKEAEYQSVHLWKENGCIFVRTVCDDGEGGTLQFLYHYDKTVTLQRIDCEAAGRSTVYYDRQEELKRLAEQAGYTHSCPTCANVDEHVRQHLAGLYQRTNADAVRNQGGQERGLIG